MRSNRYYKFILLLILVSASWLHVCSAWYDNVEAIDLKKLDFSGDSIMPRILEDVTDNVKYGSHPAPCTVEMSKYDNGILICIYRSKSEYFDVGFPLGYTIINNCLIVFRRPSYSDLYPFDFCKDSEKITINTTHPNFEQRTDKKYFYILGDLYARYSPEAGWIWSDGKPDE